MQHSASTLRGDVGADASAEARPLQMIVRLARAIAQARTDPAMIAEVAARTLVGGWADACWIHLVGSFQTQAIAHRDHDTEEHLRETLQALEPSELPVRGVLASGKPVFVAHVGADMLERTPPEIRVHARRLPLRGVIMVPIRAKDAVVGALSVWRDRNDDPFRDSDLDTAHVCAEHVGLALEHAAVFQALRDREARSEMVARATQDALWDWDLRTDHVEWNESLHTNFAWDHADVRPHADWWVAQIHPDDRERIINSVERAIREQPQGQRWKGEYRFRRGDGRYAHIIDRGYVMRDADGRAIRMVGSMQDVSERVAVERQLMRREESYRAFVANSSEGIWCFEGEGVPIDLPPARQIELWYGSARLVECNDAMARMYGYERAEDIRGMAMDPLFPRDDPRMSAYMHAFIGNGYTLVDLESVERDRDGREHWFLNNLIGTVIDGKLVRTWATQREVTELAAQTAALGRYQMLSEHGRDIILFVRVTTGEIFEANQAAVAAYGYSRDELLALTIDALRAPATRGDIADRLADADREGLLFETEHRRKDGTTFPVEVSTRGADVHGERVLLSIIRDITQRRSAETAAHRAGALLQAVLETTPDLVFAKDREGRVVFANPATLGAIGKPAAEVLGRRDAEFLGDAQGRAISEHDLQVLNSGQNEFFEERGPDGRIYLSSKSPYRDASGAVIGLLGISMDITDRKQAEERVRRNQEALALVMRAGRMGTWMLDITTDAAWLSRELEEILGLPPGAALAGEGQLYNAVHPDDRSFLAAEISAAVADRRDYMIEFRFIRADTGEHGWMEGRGRASYDQSGRTTMIYGIGIDITDRKRAELALRDSEELFARAFGKNPNPMTVNLLPSGQYLEVNEAALRTNGFTREEMLGKTPHDLELFIDREGRERFEKLLDARGTVRDAEFNLRDRSGRTHTVLMSAEIIEYRKQPCVLTVSVDISARKRAEWALLESEERFRQIAAIIDEAFWLMEFQPLWRFVYVSPGWRGAWGHTADELYADPTLWSSLVHPDDRAAVEASQRDLVAGAVDSRDLEYRIRRPDGEVVWVRDRGTLIRDAEGRPWRAAGIAEDITERKLAERERERLVADLRIAITVRDDFLSVASHELRTPLTALGFHIEHLVRLVERGERNPDVLTRKVAGASRQSDRVLALIDSLLDVSRMSLGQLALDIAEFDIAALLREVVARLAPDAERGRCELRLSVPFALVGAWDRRQLDQVIHNLISNAIKYGAGHPIDIRARPVDGFVDIEVEDRGIGIAEEDMARIFDRFERAVSSQHYGGFGLGLYVARRMVEAHGGTLDVVSAPGRGSTFRVRLPFTGVTP